MQNQTVFSQLALSVLSNCSLLSRTVSRVVEISRRSYFIIPVLAWSLLTAGTLRGQEYTNWIAGEGAWNSDQNWSNGIPDANVSARVGNSGTAIVQDTTATAKSLLIGYEAGQDGAVLAQNCHLSAENITVGAVWSQWGEFSPGNLSLVDSTCVVGGTLRVSAGTVNIEGTSELDTNVTQVGSGDFVSGSTPLVVQSGGTHTCSMLSLFGHSVDAVYRMEGGQLNAGSISLKETTVLDQRGGSISVADSITLDHQSQYAISGNSTLSAKGMYLPSMSRFDQTGGVVGLSGHLQLDFAELNISGGELNAPIEVRDSYIRQSGGRVTGSLFVPSLADCWIRYDFSDGILACGSISLGGHPLDSSGRLFSQSGGLLESQSLNIGGGTFTLTGGEVRVTGVLSMGTGGSYEAGGVHGEFIRTGGQLTASTIHIGSGTSRYRDSSNNGLLRLDGGATSASVIRVGTYNGFGSVKLNETASLTCDELSFGDGSSSYPADLPGGGSIEVRGGSLTAGTISIKTGAKLHLAGNVSCQTLVVGAENPSNPTGIALLGGYGRIPAGTVVMNGRTTASGGELDLSEASLVETPSVNPLDGEFGWYVEQRGQLKLPEMTIHAGSGFSNWGQSQDREILDFVNSVQLAFSDVTQEGTASIAMWGRNATGVPRPALAKDLPLYVVDFSPGVAASELRLSTRYDPVALAAAGYTEADLSILTFDGQKWRVVLDSVTDPTHRIISSLITADVRGFAVVPEPETLLLLALAGLAVMRRR